MWRDNIYIAIGSNKGDSLSNIKDSLELLKANKKVKLETVSSVYKTKPWGYENQDDFLNLVVKVSSSLSHIDLFNFLQSIEKQMGREKQVRYGPRNIDLDLIFYDDVVFHNEFLDIPHPRVCERDFVLIPLLEISKDMVHPESSKKLDTYVQSLKERFILEKISFEGLL
jgi:2-amino-4-hydroxy-6-hydroxymethyldihydropteridine diphosphokinase